MKQNVLTLFVVLFFSIIGLSQNTMIYNNTAIDMLVRIHYNSTGASCAPSCIETHCIPANTAQVIYDDCSGVPVLCQLFYDCDVMGGGGDQYLYNPFTLCTNELAGTNTITWSYASGMYYVSID